MDRWETLKAELLKWFLDAEGEEEALVLTVVMEKMNSIEQRIP